MPTEALVAVIRPTAHGGSRRPLINFPAFLGKTSAGNRRKKLLEDLSHDVFLSLALSLFLYNMLDL